MDFFGKKGLPWHCTWVVQKTVLATVEQFKQLGIVHVFDSATQDASAVLAILKDNIQTLKSVMPQLKEVFCRSDNAGAYHCAQTILSLQQISEETGVKISCYDYSDVQYGKGAADRLAAKTKQHVRQYLNSGHNITSASEFAAGTRRMTGTIVKHGKIQVAPIGGAKGLKWPGISKFYNFQFTEDGKHVVVHKAYNIGEGMRIELSTFKPDMVSSVPQFLPDPDQKNVPDAATLWQPIKFRIIDEEETSTHPISCPEDGCQGSFLHENELEDHLLTSSHKYQIEKETMSDMAMRTYAEKQDTLVLKLEVQKLVLKYNQWAKQSAVECWS